MADAQAQKSGGKDAVAPKDGTKNSEGKSDNKQEKAETKKIVWKVPMSAAEQKQTVKVNTNVAFTWSGTHNVYQFATKADFDKCDFAKAKKLGEKSPYNYKASSAGVFYFGCQIIGHCQSQKLALTVTGSEGKVDSKKSGGDKEEEDPSVCGKDGITYPTECHALCNFDAATPFHPGACKLPKQRNCPKRCGLLEDPPAESDPVCSASEKTYDSACLAECDDAPVFPGGGYKKGKCLDCSKIVCKSKTCPDGSKRVRIGDDCCACRKNPICPATKLKSTTKTEGSWLLPGSWEHNSVPTKVDVVVVPKAVSKGKKFALKAAQGSVALDIRIKDENVDLVIGRGTTGSLVIGPDPKNDLCTGSLDCKMEVKGSLEEGQAVIKVGGQFSISADGKTIKDGHRGVRLGCLPDWQTIEGDDKKVYTCGMVNNFLDGFDSNVKCSEDKCPKTCQGQTCDAWTISERYTCTELEEEYGCNCWKCNCRNLEQECSKDLCLGKTCDEWSQAGYGCEQLEKNFKCGCTGCKCTHDHDPKPPVNIKMLEGLSNIGGPNNVAINDIGALAFNEAFTRSNGIIYRFCPHCDPSHQHIYYRRFGDFKNTKPNVYMLMACDWTDVNNVMGKDFKLYSTYQDALAGKPNEPGKKDTDTGSWKYCNYLNFKGKKPNAMGAFRDCGPVKPTSQWSVMIGAGDGVCNAGYHKGKQASFSIMTVDYYDKCLGVECNPESDCLSAGQCDPKTGKCKYTVRNIGKSCDDKNGNTKKTTCNPLGECVGDWVLDLCIGKPPCQALSQCHAVGQCNKANGECSYPFKKKGSKCNDGDSSTVDDVCDGEGFCSGANKCAAVICKPLSDCHVAGKCNKVTGQCSNPKKPQGSKCDDDDYKTVGDKCDAKGVCQGKNLCEGVVCKKKSQCHKIPKCNYKTGFCDQIVDVGAKCDDGNSKTVEDKCDAKGVCKGIDKCKDVTCKAMSQCHNIGVCNITDGVCSNPFTLEGVACDDKNPKTGLDQCNGAGVCKGRNLCPPDKVCFPKSQCHEGGTCDPGTGICSNPVLEEGTECDDENDNTIKDACTAKGVCTGTALKDLCTDETRKKCLTAPNFCSLPGKCNPGTGECIFPPKAKGTKCNDNNAKTGEDVCDGENQCKGRDMCIGVKCAPAKNQCQINVCDSGTGKCVIRNKKHGTPCNDNIAITVEDRCELSSEGKDKPFVCKGVDKCKDVKCPMKVCFEPSKCNYLNGKCGAIGAVMKDGSSCDDDDPGTENDKCKAGKCAGTKIQSCLMITGVFNGPMSKGPTGVELYAFCDIINLNLYGLGTSKNGKGTEGKEFAFTGKKKSAKNEEFFYVANDAATFKKYFKFEPEFVWNKIGINGDDAVELFLTLGPKEDKVIDAYGLPDVDGTNKDWEYTKGFGYRKDQKGPSGAVFVPTEWQLNGKNKLKGAGTNGGAMRYGGKVPIGTYCRKLPCIRLTTTTSTTTTTTTTARATTTSTTSTTTTTTTLAGCTNKAACNYNKDAKGDDGSCELPKKCHNCKGECICDKDQCGVCGGKGPGSDMEMCGAQKNVQVNWVGDKTCDDAHNICVCGWDGGDCCGEANDYKYCKKCKCLDKEFKEEEKKGDCGKCSGKCGKPVYAGDGYCDDENNVCGCDWDGGDCCGGDNNYKYCKKCKCLDCTFESKKDDCVNQIKGKCGIEKWKGDKNCDDENNNAGCNWDGGDCCGAQNNYGYCKDCKCKDCTHVAKGDKCVDAIKKGCGATDFVGDKYCDDNNNNAGCNWDKGDCCGPANNYDYCKACKCLDCTYVAKGDDCVKEIKKGCGAPNWKGDNNCDDNNNNAGCNWDGGDCCGVNIYKYCKACECLDCTYKKKGDKCIDDFKRGCGAPKFKGDGFCDDNNNYGGCNWDGGDCCGDKANIKYCKLCECRDCTKAPQKKCSGKKVGCKYPGYKKDKNCDDENNNCRCDWDGGDCCGKSNNGQVITKYCKECKCLDPENQEDSNCPGSCGLKAYKGDGNCDDQNNNCGCEYDGGDCCAKTNGGAVKTKYCSKCQCLDPKGKQSSDCTGSCGAPKYKKDGNCDDNNNNCGCEYDGGDCCEKTNGGKVKTQYCKTCACLDPNGKSASSCSGSCGAPKYKGDGNCDDNNNNCGCQYDGGDCCAKTVQGGKVKTQYCNACACLDPKGK